MMNNPPKMATRVGVEVPAAGRLSPPGVGDTWAI